MISHVTNQLALRAKLQTLLVLTSGLTTLSATLTGYVRTSGSFLTDGFAAGMEITPLGFVSNPVDTITLVTALTITTVSARTVEKAAGNRSLTVAFPTRFEKENETLAPDPRHPYAEEQYMPGPSRQISSGMSALINGFVVGEPMYAPRIYVPQGAGILAGGKYADAILSLFRTNTVLPLTNGDQLRVRGDVGPFAGQRLPNAQHTHSMVPITVPLRLYTSNLA